MSNLDADLADSWTTDLFKRSFCASDKNTIYRKYKGNCAYCGKHLSRKKAQFDHIIPWRKGGPSTVENGAVSCRSCNVRKVHRGDRDAPTLLANLFFRRVHATAAMGPKRWGGYLWPKRINLLGLRNGK